MFPRLLHNYNHFWSNFCDYISKDFNDLDELYKLISNSGPRHKPLFKVGVKLPNTKYFISTGKSKKDAEPYALFWNNFVTEKLY